MTWKQIPEKWMRSALAVSVLCLSAYFLFVNLGHYALWDDESVSALVAEGVQRTGDTSVIIGQNIVAYRGGLLVRDGKDRSTPPLSTYLTATSFSIFGVSAWSARLPSASFGLALVALLLWWLRNHSLRTQVIFSLALLGNVSLFLFCRQARYYAAALFFSTAIVYIYTRWRGAWQGALGMAILGIFLFAANYLAYAALTICLILDYCLWQHRKIALSWKVLIVLALPQSVALAMIAMVWNPFGTAFGSYVTKNSLLDRLELFFWNLRDLNSAEFLVAPLVLAAFFLAWKYKDQLLTRMLVALLTYAGFVSLVSPQTLFNTTVADIRYLVPLIPLGIALETLVIVRLTKGFRVLWLAVALLAFETNVTNGGPFLSSGARSTIAEFFRELVSPPPEPYSLAADWVAQNVKLGQSVVVLPDYMVYPLMFKAPHAVYGWQFKNVDKPSFQDLGEIHFEGRVPPDFFIVFGPIVSDFLKASSQWKEEGWRYEHFATINSYWKDLYRPELFWRTFSPVLQFDPNWEAIQIFRRIYEEPR